MFPYAVRTFEPRPRYGITPKGEAGPARGQRSATTGRQAVAEGLSPSLSALGFARKRSWSSQGYSRGSQYCMYMKLQGLLGV
jgi:hypothetical protein